MSTVTIKTDAYNARRYSRPYIAICTDRCTARHWGEWFGTEGYEGELTIAIPDREPVILMTGKKDYRNPRKSAPLFSVWVDDKQLCAWSEDKAAVRRFFLEEKSVR